MMTCRLAAGGDTRQRRVAVSIDPCGPGSGPQVGVSSSLPMAAGSGDGVPRHMRIVGHRDGSRTGSHRVGDDASSASAPNSSARARSTTPRRHADKYRPGRRHRTAARGGSRKPTSKRRSMRAGRNPPTDGSSSRGSSKPPRRKSTKPSRTGHSPCGGSRQPCTRRDSNTDPACRQSTPGPTAATRRPLKLDRDAHLARAGSYAVQNDERGRSGTDPGGRGRRMGREDPPARNVGAATAEQERPARPQARG